MYHKTACVVVGFESAGNYYVRKIRSIYALEALLITFAPVRVKWNMTLIISLGDDRKVVWPSLLSDDPLNSGRCQVTPVTYTHATIEERCIL